MSQRKPIIAGLLAVLIGVGVWGLYWLWAADQAETAITRWADAQRAEGYEVAFDGPHIGGFPGRLSVRLGAPRIASPRGWRWSGGTVAGEADLWAPRTLRLELPRRQDLSATWRGQERSLSVEAGEARGVVRLDLRGRVEAATLDLADVTVREAGGGAAHAEALRYELVTRPPRPGGPGDWTLEITGQVSGLALAGAGGGPLGDTLERLALEATMIGLVPAGEPAEALAAWRDRGGALVVESLDLLWGPLAVRARGRAALDAALRPAGGFDARIRGLPEVVDVLAAQGAIEPGAALALRMSVFALSRPGEDDGRPVVNLPVTLRDGLLYLGPVAVFSVGPVL